MNIKEIPSTIQVACDNYKIRTITKKDKEILMTHKFEEIHSEYSSIKDHVFKCKLCLVEADMYTTENERAILAVFFKKKQRIKFETCEQILMKIACE